MRCDEFDHRIQSLLDARKRPEWDNQLQAHSLNCPDCERRLSIQEELFDALEQFEPPAPSRQVELPAIASPAMDVERPWRPYLAAVVAAAACLVLFFTIRAGVRDGDSTESQHAAVSRPPITESMDGDVELAFHGYVLMFAVAESHLEDALDTQRLRSSLRPIASSFHVAFDALRRTLPLRGYWPEDETTGQRFAQQPLLVI